MNKISLRMGSAMLSLAMLCVSQQLLAQVELEDPTYVVVLKKARGAHEQARALGAAHGASHIYQSVFPGFAAKLSPQALSALQHNPNVDFIEPEFMVYASEETLPTGIDRIDAELAHAAGIAGQGARVAIIDTGIDFTHEDLVGHKDTLVASKTFILKLRTNTDGRDDNGHGTHVAGTVAASDNEVGVIGVAPQATLIALKVLNSKGSGTSTDIIAALDYVKAHNDAATSYANMIHVANLSLGGEGSDTDSAYRQAFDALVGSGCFVAVAAGNETDDAANHVPAAYDSVFTVSAIDPLTGAFAWFSNFGADVDIAAPGVAILSTLMGGGYGEKNGTSMATPHVAGTAALFVADNLASLTKGTAVLAIRQALLGTGEYVAFAGDPDGIAEPLVDAEAVTGEIQPALHLSLATDQESYSPTDAVAGLIALPVDELQQPVLGLSAVSFTVTVDGVIVEPIAFVETDGSYALTIDISGFEIGVAHAVSVTVVDARLLGAAGALSITRTEAPLVSVIHVSAIGYQLISVPSMLYVDVTVSGETGAVAGASVSVTLLLNGKTIGTGTAVTNSAGVVTFSKRKPANGVYTTRIDNVVKDGFVYDAALNAADPTFTK